MTPILIRLGILIAVFMTVFLLSQVVVASVLNRRAEADAVNRRMLLLRSGRDRDAVSASLLKNSPPLLSPTASLFERAYIAMLRMVMTSGVTIDARTLFIMCGGAIAAIFIVVILLIMVQSTLTLGMIQLAAAVAVAIGAGLPLMVLSRLAQRRRKRMQEQFPNALDVFIRALRAGHPIASAIDLIATEMDDPIGSEFGMVADAVAYGAELGDALLAMAERWDMEDIRMFVVCVSVQTETGGNLAEILENLASVIRDRASMYMKVRALSSEGRMTGWMLTVLPVLAFIVLFLINPGFYLDVAGDPIFMIGFPSLICLYVVGVFSIRRLVDLKV